MGILILANGIFANATEPLLLIYEIWNLFTMKNTGISPKNTSNVLEKSQNHHLHACLLNMTNQMPAVATKSLNSRMPQKVVSKDAAVLVGIFKFNRGLFDI